MRNSINSEVIDMSKLKATQSGKAGKHKGQDSFNTAFVRGVRTARVTTSPDGARAGSRHTNLSVRA
jgi:hypothetical protein